MSIDWTKGMQQTFEFYKVDPYLFEDVEKLDTITQCTINRDSSSESLGSAQFTMTKDIDECYVRTYLIVTQNEKKERYILGTHLIQSPSFSYDGKVRTTSADGYTTLIELKEKYMPIGYSLSKGSVIMDVVCNLTSENARAPITFSDNVETSQQAYVADLNDTYLSYLSTLMKTIDYAYNVEPDGRIIFEKKRDPFAISPVWTYNDNNSSILQPQISMNRDLFGIPNVVEIVYSSEAGSAYYKVVNNIENSPVSIQNRGREIVYRETNPSFLGVPNEQEIREYAEKVLRDKSSIEYSVTYTHGYCPVTVGDCVELNYSLAGLTGVKAIVKSQNISCTTGCQVTETATFTKNLWKED